jgi:hypothetical protein
MQNQDFISKFLKTHKKALFSQGHWGIFRQKKRFIHHATCYQSFWRHSKDSQNAILNNQALVGY